MITPKLPTIEELQANLTQLAAHPGSVVFITIENAPSPQDAPIVTWSWFTPAERKGLLAGLRQTQVEGDQPAPPPKLAA